MNFKNRIVLLISLVFILSSCEQTFNKKVKKINFEIENRYKNSGFALINVDNLENKKKT